MPANKTCIHSSIFSIITIALNTSLRQNEAHQHEARIFLTQLRATVTAAALPQRCRSAERSADRKRGRKRGPHGPQPRPRCCCRALGRALILLAIYIAFALYGNSSRDSIPTALNALIFGAAAALLAPTVFVRRG